MQRIANPSSPVRLWIAPPKSSFGIKKIAPSGAIFVCGWYLVTATLSWTEIGQERIPVAFDQSSRLRPVYAVLHPHTSWQGYPLQSPALPTPTFSNGSLCEHLYCVSLKRFEIWRLLSDVESICRVIVVLGKVGEPAS